MHKGTQKTMEQQMSTMAATSPVLAATTTPPSSPVTGGANISTTTTTSPAATAAPIPIPVPVSTAGTAGTANGTTRPRRDSWPPAEATPRTSVFSSAKAAWIARRERADRALALSEGDLDLAKMDEDPLVYFLTPPSPVSPDEEEEQVEAGDRVQGNADKHGATTTAADNNNQAKLHPLEARFGRASRTGHYAQPAFGFNRNFGDLGDSDSSEDEDALLYSDDDYISDDDDDGMEFMDVDFGLDAGIEGASPRAHEVRAVSPSSLDDRLDRSRPAASRRAAGGVVASESPLSLSPDRGSERSSNGSGATTPVTLPGTPPPLMTTTTTGKSTATAASYDGPASPDGEDFIRFPGFSADESDDALDMGLGLGLPLLSLRDFAQAAGRKQKPAGGSANRGRPRFAAPIHAPTPRRHNGGYSSRPHRYAAPGRLSPPHSWREPSPDVWSIAEEAEEEEEEKAPKPSSSWPTTTTRARSGTVVNAKKVTSSKGAAAVVAGPAGEKMCVVRPGEGNGLVFTVQGDRDRMRRERERAKRREREAGRRAMEEEEDEEGEGGGGPDLEMDLDNNNSQLARTPEEEGLILQLRELKVREERVARKKAKSGGQRVRFLLPLRECA